MGLESLFVFTLLGGLATGAYAFETVLRRKREGARPWLVPLVVVVLFAVALIAAATHIQSFAHMFASVFSGAVNLGAGMVHEVVVAGLFFVLALIDLIVVFIKKDSPFALRAVTAVVAVVCLVMMGVAYIDILGNPVWCSAPATVLSFLGGGLATGMALYVALSSESYETNNVRVLSIAANVILALGIALEIAAFSGNGINPVSQIAALLVAPVASIVLVALAHKIGKAKTLAIIICILSIVGVAISRYAFYATNALM